jgi:hypothetical protein
MIILLDFLFRSERIARRLDMAADALQKSRRHATVTNSERHALSSWFRDRS